MKANLRISRFTSNVEPFQGIDVTVHDATSGCRILELRITLEDLALALTGAGCDGEAEWSVANLGLTHEHKTELVRAKVKYGDESAGQKALAPYEVDGWVGDVSGLWNGHRRNTDGSHTVTFHRYVEAK